MNKRSLLIALAVIVVLALGAFAYVRSSRGTSEAEGQMSDGEVKAIVSSVGRHIRLPEGEEPLIATIADIDILLEREPFYRGAKNGDILLLYQNAGKAILYAPDDDIIINVGPILLDQEAETGTETETTEEGAPDAASGEDQ